MTLEQAIEVLISRYNSGVIRSRTNDDEWRLATDTVIAALRGPQPDPDTGLMPCGCGGIPEFREDKTEPKFGIYTVMCSKCNIRLSGYTNRIDFLKIDWNRAMGWRDDK